MYKRDWAHATGAYTRIILTGQPLAFLVWCGSCRRVFIVDHNLVVQRELDLRSKGGCLSELSWLSDAALLATSSDCIQGWTYSYGNSQPCLLLGRSIGLISARPSPDHSTLAAGSRDGVVSRLQSSSPVWLAPLTGRFPDLAYGKSSIAESACHTCIKRRHSAGLSLERF